MRLTRPVALSAQRFQLTARTPPFGEISSHPLTHLRPNILGQRHAEPALLATCKSNNIGFGNRGFKTSSVTNATGRNVKKTLPDVARSKPTSRTIPSFTSKASPSTSQKLKTSKATANGSRPSTPLPSSTLSPSQGESEQIYVLRHFKKPEPMFVRGIPADQDIPLSILHRLRRRSPMTPETVPRLRGPGHQFFQQSIYGIQRYELAAIATILAVLFIYALMVVLRPYDEAIIRLKRKSEVSNGPDGSPQSGLNDESGVMDAGTNRPADGESK